MSDQPQPESSRRLAAIMFTDMVGYSALTQRNEAVALTLLTEHNSLIRTALKAHAGREIKTVGDAFLAEFDSALEAVRCAIRIQREFSERNGSAAGEPIRIRIGVHLGDVVYREGDVFGDGVNIAARVQSSGEAGQIRLSEDVARQVGNKLEYPLKDLGLTPLKNIEQPMHIFSVALPWEAIDEPSADLAATDAANAKVTTLPSHSSLAPASISTALQAMARNRIAMLGVVAVTVALTATFFAYRYLASANSKTIESIAVLPFENATGDPAIDYLSDGISESLINKLASLNGLRVISRTSAFALKGKKLDPIEIGKKLGVDALILGNLVQRGTSLTISSELVRASNATQLWGEKYIRQADDVLKVWDYEKGEQLRTIRGHGKQVTSWRLGARPRTF